MLFAFSVFAQENVPFDFPAEFSGTFEPIPPPEEVLPFGELPQSAIPSKKESAVKEPETISRAEVKIDTEGSTVFLDFRDADIREVARVLSKISGVSILIGEDVKAKVTLNIEGVTWKKALELILRTYNLAMIEKGDFIIVVTYEKILEEQEQVPLKTEILRLNFVDIDEAKTYLKSVLSQRGTIEGDIRTNSLIVTDTPEAIEKTREIVQGLDIRTPQVLIEVLMVDKKVTDAFSFGIDWSTTDTGGGQETIGFVQDLNLSAAAGTLTYGKSNLFNHHQLTATIEALASDASVDIVANPKILTLDNVTAKIKIVEQIPYTQETESTDGGSTTSTQFKDTGVNLSVKPHITPDGHIILDVETEQSFRVDFTPDNEPIIDSRTSESTMMIMDGQTVVIGGLRKKNDTTTLTKVPLLGDIPFIGKLFTREITSNITREFLIFITPTVIKEPLKVAGTEENSKIIAENLAHDKERRQAARGLIGYEDRSIEKDLGKIEEAEPKAEDLDETSEIVSQFYRMARSSYMNKDYLKAKELFTRVYNTDSNYKNTSRYLELTVKAIAAQELIAKAKQENEQGKKESLEEKHSRKKEIEETLTEIDNLNILPAKGLNEGR